MRKDMFNRTPPRKGSWLISALIVAKSFSQLCAERCAATVIIVGFVNKQEKRPPCGGLFHAGAVRFSAYSCESKLDGPTT